MKASKKVFGMIAIFIPFGLIIAGVGYWFYQYLTDPEDAPSISDLPGIGMSYLQRGWLIVQGQVSNLQGSSADPVAIALGLTAQEEGFSPKAYPDPPGQTQTYSIGYGHQIVPGDGFDKTSTISQSDALALLQSDMANYVAAVNAAVTQTLSPQQLAALYDFCYNEGIGAFQSSTLLKDINAGDYADAVNEFARWDIAGGAVSSALSARRQKEMDLFNSGLSGDATSDGSDQSV